MDFWAKNSSTWKLVKGFYVKNSGDWVSVRKAWVKSSGSWKNFWDNPPPVANANLLLHFDADPFVDSSGHNHTITNSNVALETTVVKPGFNDSGNFNGNYMSVPSHADFNFGTGDFTVDFWVYLNSESSGYQMFIDREPGWRLYWFGNLGVSGDFYFNDALTFPMNIPSGAWTHIAIVRSTDVVNVYLNGTACDAGQSYATSMSGTSPLYIGTAYNLSQPLGGYMDELRIVNGSAEWTDDFTPPTSPYA